MATPTSHHGHVEKTVLTGGRRKGRRDRPLGQGGSFDSGVLLSRPATTESGGSARCLRGAPGPGRAQAPPAINGKRQDPVRNGGEMKISRTEADAGALQALICSRVGAMIACRAVEGTTAPQRSTRRCTDRPQLRPAVQVTPHGRGLPRHAGVPRSGPTIPCARDTSGALQGENTARPAWTDSSRRGAATSSSCRPRPFPAAEAGLQTGRPGDHRRSLDAPSSAWRRAGALGQGGDQTSITSARSTRGAQDSLADPERSWSPPVPAPSLEPGDVGVVRIAVCAQGDARRVDQAISSLKKRGATRLLLDLRGCAPMSSPRGSARPGLFVSEGGIVTLTDRYEGDNPSVRWSHARVDGPLPFSRSGYGGVW